MNRSCPRCYAPLHPTESPQGLCPKCILAVAMGEDAVLRNMDGAPVAPPPDLAELGPHFPQLELLGLVGRGGAGAVYRARQRDLGREVALKVLTLDPNLDPAFGERFVREAQAMASLTHPGIAAVYDAGRAGPYWYLLLEFVDGLNLRQVIQAGDLTASEALDVTQQICSALEYAHGQGVVHRDVKPENVLRDVHGRVSLVDFGLAKLLQPGMEMPTLTRTAQAMGTWHYMAPEQIRRPLEVDHRADIYSLGVVLYELLTGELPLGRFAPPSTKAKTDRRLDEVVFRSLEQDPKNRYQQASSVREDMERIARTPDQEPAAPAPDGRPQQAADGRLPWWVYVGSGALGLLMLSLLAMVLRAGESTPEPPRRPVPPSGFSGVPGADAVSGPEFLLASFGLSPGSEELAWARGAWEDYLQLVSQHTEVVPFVTPKDRWLQLETKDFQSERGKLETRLRADISRAVARGQWSKPSRELSRVNIAWPEGSKPRRMQVRWDGSEAKVKDGNGFDRQLPLEDLPAAASLVEEILSDQRDFEALMRTPEVLPFEPGEVGLDAIQTSAEALLVARDLRQAYLELEADASLRESLPDGSVEVTVQPFNGRFERARQEARRSMQALGAGDAWAQIDLGKLAPLGDRGKPVQYRIETRAGRRQLTLLDEQPRRYGSTGPVPFEWQHLLGEDEPKGKSQVTEGWEPAEVGLVGEPSEEVLAAVQAARESYLQLERRHRLPIQLEDGRSGWAISGFAKERDALLNGLMAQLAGMDPGAYGGGGLPLGLEVLFEFGTQPTLLALDPLEGGAWTVSISLSSDGSEQNLGLDELGWRFGRFQR